MAQDIARVYNAAPTLAKFHASEAPIRLVRGPVGSGKSVALGAIEVVKLASEVPPSQDGIRRSRCVVVRNTLQQLKSTCLVTMQEWLRPISYWKVSEATLYLNFTPADGIPVACEVLMLPLDTPENQQRLLSLELTFAWVSEFREIPLEILQAVFSRCGRYPSRANVPDYHYCLFGETNSFSEDSDYYDFLETEAKPANVNYFVQPGAFDEGAENRENLPARYYEDLLEANSEAWCEQYIHNKITASLSGQAVFAKTFNPEFHIRERLYPDFSRAIVLGVDTGRNPALVAGQIDSRGRLLVLGSVWAENMGIEKFIATTVRPFLTEHFTGGKFFISMDPAGRQRSQIGEESVKLAVERLGYSVILAATNDITPRIRAVERYLNLQVNGSGGMLIDRRLNNDLLLALQKNYRYPRDKKGVLAEKPEKGHPESDLADGLQYLCLSAASNVLARAMTAPIAIAPKPP
ncbi:MAG: hypothetical protein DRI24_16845, partial [Deltaproteobacteria bacterium]